MAVEGNMSSCDEEEDAVVEIGIVVAAVADGERRRAADDGEGTSPESVDKLPDRNCNPMFPLTVPPMLRLFPNNTSIVTLHTLVELPL
nr:hypothetical protein Iba_chr04fCG14200 [Ipomoea batatas]